MAYKILVLPGDGIGQECMAEVQKIMNWFKDNKNIALRLKPMISGVLPMINMARPLPMKP